MEKWKISQTTNQLNTLWPSDHWESWKTKKCVPRHEIHRIFLRFCGSPFFKGPKFGVPKKTPWSLKNCVCFKKVSECKKITLFLCCHVLCWASKLTKLQSRVFVSKTKTTPQRTACYEGSFGKDSTFPYNHMTKYYTVAAITLIRTRLLLFFWAHSATKIVVQSQKSLKPIPRPLKRVPRRWLHFLAKINGLF